MVIDRIYEWARSRPDDAALVFDDAVIGYAPFARAVEALRLSLQRQGLPAGTTAIVLVSHLADAWVVVMALRQLGLTTLHVPSLATARALRIRNASCVVVSEVEQAAHHVTAAELADLGKLRLVVAARPDPAAVAAGEPPRPHEGPVGDHILYTSGTTGVHKKLLWDSASEAARSRLRARCNDFGKATVINVLGFALGTGVGWKFSLAVWQAGGCVVIDQRAERFRRFFRHGVSFANLTPVWLKGLVAADGNDRGAGQPFELWVGGAPIGADLVGKAMARFGERICVHHSSTELIAPSLVSPLRRASDSVWLQPAPDRTVQIVDDAGHECAPGTEGELRILRAELDWAGYLDDDEATARVFRDGFFYPGDRAVRRADGRIRITGRTADVLNLQGEKVAVAPLEERIRRYLRVDEVCLFSGLDEAGREELVVAIRSEREPPRERLETIRRRFGAFDKVRFALLREFPRTETGSAKVRRAELRRLVFPDAGAGF